MVVLSVAQNYVTPILEIETLFSPEQIAEFYIDNKPEHSSAQTV